MNRCTKSRRIFWYLLPNFTCYGLTILLSIVLLCDSVGASLRNTPLQIAQKSGTTQQDANRAAAERAYQDGLKLYNQRTAESLQGAREKD